LREIKASMPEYVSGSQWWTTVTFKVTSLPLPLLKKKRSKLPLQLLQKKVVSNAAFTLSSYNDQERNLTFEKNAFQDLKLKFLAYSMKQAFYSLYKRNIAQA